MHLTVSCRLLALVMCCAVMQSCASYGRHAMTMRDGLLTGQPQVSLAIAEQEDPGQQDVIASLDKGMLRRMNGDYRGSNKIFEVAKRKIETLYGVSITESLASVTINEKLSDYKGDWYEQLLLHAFMAQNYIDLGSLDAARVEMKQADVKMRELGDEPEDDAWVRYLEGMIFESLGEYDNARISYQKAYTVYKEKGGSHYPEVPATLKKDLLRLLAWQGMWDEYKRLRKELGMEDYQPYKASDQFGELIVILNNGLAPIRSQTIIPMYSTEVQQSLQIAFPVYKQPKKNLLTPQVVVNGRKAYDMDTVEDVDALARYSLQQAMPGITARAMARAVVKYNTQHTANDNSALAGFLMTVANLVTEQADTRSWTTLPQAIQLSRVLLPVGEQEVAIQMKGAGGSTVDVLRETVTISPKRPSFVIRHWTAPVKREVVKPDSLKHQAEKHDVMKHDPVKQGG
jgi:hypothetical protein